jgi:hypothetical protein
VAVAIPPFEADVPDEEPVLDDPAVPDVPLPDGALPRGAETDGAFVDGRETCGVLGAEGVGRGGTVTDGVVTPPFGVGTVTEGTVVPWGNVTALLGPALAPRLEDSPTTSTASTTIFLDVAGLEHSSAREATPGGES